MADFQSQAMGLTDLTIDASSTTPSRSEFSQFLNDGVIDVTNRWLEIKPQDINEFARESSEQTSNGSLDLDGAKIISVIREDGVTSNNWRSCRQISPSQQYLVTNTESLSFASKFNPTYMIGDNGKMSVFPAPGADPNAFKVYYVNNSPEETDGTALDHASTGIKYFPSDKIYLVILYASMRSLQVKMGSKEISTTTIGGTAWATAFPDEYSAINTALAAIATEVGLAKTEAAEIASQTDNSGEIETALDAMKTELDKVDNVIVEASTELDKSTALLDLGETDSEGAVNTAADKIITEMDETQAVCDSINADLVLAKAEVVLAKNEAAELATFTDRTSSTFQAAADAMVTELGKVDDAIVEASNIYDIVDEVIIEGSNEFDEAKNLSKAYNSGEVYDALQAMATELNKVDNIIATAQGKVDNFYTDTADIDDTTELWDNTNKRFTVVRDSLLQAQNLIDNSEPHADYDVEANLADLDAALTKMSDQLDDGETVLGAAPGSGDIYTALTAIKANIDLANGVVDTPPVPPDTPTLSSTSVSITGTAPTYTAPTVGSATEGITASMDADSAGYGTDADFLNFSKWFSVVGELIEDEEDTELAAI